METNLKFYISYFYQIRFLPADIIPISTALSDPEWFKGDPHFDSRGVLLGINFPEFHHPAGYSCGCPCSTKNPGVCRFLRTYRGYLDLLDRDTEIYKFESLAEYLRGNGIPVHGFCLIVYETPENPCSERVPLQELWDVWGLELSEFR